MSNITKSLFELEFGIFHEPNNIWPHECGLFTKCGLFTNYPYFKLIMLYILINLYYKKKLTTSITPITSLT